MSDTATRLHPALIVHSLEQPSRPEACKVVGTLWERCSVLGG
jgi:hypothetical protein